VPTPGSTGEPSARQAIAAELELFIPQLYRTLALYLQVLRQCLPQAVDQACFHLATQVHGSRYARLPVRRRRHLHQRLGSLVQRCLSLLTVEQLAGLAARMAQEAQALQEAARADGTGPLHHRLSHFIDDGDDDDLPEGSVRLHMELPIDTDVGGWHPTDLMELDDDEPLIESDQESEGPLLSSAVSSALMEAVTQALNHALGEAAGAAAAASAPWQQGDMPRDPLLLMQWLDGWERALVRRLRNLSHAINVEFLHAGLGSSTLPLPLLDAVLDGQVDSQSAPANLLRLELPFGMGSGMGGGIALGGGQAMAIGPLQVSALLLRCTDLELEEPRLRTCRHRLLQKRQELRRMAGQFRRLQRRLEAREAERLWLQDIQTNRAQRPPTSP